MSETQAAAPLSGFRVLDFTQVVAGPFCAAMLADMGAEVVKIERPGFGDDTRRITRYKDREEHEDYFYANNRSKKSVAINMKTGAGKAAIRALAGEADALIENMAPGKLAELGLGFEDARAANPKIVYCSLSGFGQSGPYRDRVGLDPILAGRLRRHERDGYGGPHPDRRTARRRAGGHVLRLRHRERAPCGRPRGRGPPHRREHAGRHGRRARPPDGRDAPGGRLPRAARKREPHARAREHLPHERRGVRDRHRAARRLLAGLLPRLGVEDWLEDERFSTARARVANRDAINERVSKIFASRTMAEWERRLEAERVGFSPVNDYARALSDPQIAHRGLIKTVEHPVSGEIRVVGAPWIMSGAQAGVKPPPMLGQHTAEVLGEWLDWPEEEVARFMAGEGVR